MIKPIIYLRYLGFRKLLATACYWPLVVVARTLFAAMPPAMYYAWPDSAQLSFGMITGAAYSLAFAAWCWSISSAIVWIKHPTIRQAAWLARTVAVVGMSLHGSGELARGLLLLVVQNAGYFPEVAPLFVRVAVLPIACGLIPHVAIDLCERVRTIRVLHRWQTSGTGDHASWVAPYTLKRFSRALPRSWKWW